MSWRNHENHRDESKAVKAALKQEYPGIRVRHSTGTAWGWLHIGATIDRPPDCLCDLSDNNRFPYYCSKCRETMNETDAKIIRIAKEVTGRQGEYDGEISVDIKLSA